MCLPGIEIRQVFMPGFLIVGFPSRMLSYREALLPAKHNNRCDAYLMVQ